MTRFEQDHCDQVWKCLLAKLDEDSTRWRQDLAPYRDIFDKAAIISAKLALLTMEAPTLSPEDKKLLDGIMSAKIQ